MLARDFLRGSVLVVILLVATIANGDEPVAGERLRRLEHLKVRAAALEISSRDDDKAPITPLGEPVLRYTNPVRSFLSDGATFVWLEGERPVAVGSWAIRNTGRVFRELTSLTDSPLICREADRIVWSPQAGGLLNRPLPDGPAPSPNSKLRLGQMRSLAKRFTATFEKEGTVTEMRLISQPIYRVRHETPEILDGALFAFAEATDPELLLWLETRPNAPTEKSAWKFTLARMSSLPLAVRLDDRQIWSVENFWTGPREITDPYIEANIGPYGDESAADKPGE